MAVAVLVSGCYGVPEQVDGGYGVGAGTSGAPEVHFISCGSAVVAVNVATDREGLAPEEENPVVGRWTLQPATQEGSLDLGTQPPDEPGPGFGPGTTYLLDLELAEDELLPGGGLAFTLEDLAGLGPDEVLSSGGVRGAGELGSC